MEQVACGRVTTSKLRMDKLCCMHVCMYGCMYECMDVWMHIYMCVCVCIYVCLYGRSAGTLIFSTSGAAAWAR